MLRFFMYFYDMDVVDEEVFIRWKEDVSDTFPGKGRALFQVGVWSLLYIEGRCAALPFCVHSCCECGDLCFVLAMSG